MTEEQIAEYNAKVDEVNRLLEEDPQKLNDMLRSGKCPIPVELLMDVPLGMFHCELCGTMVVAGIPHGPIDPEWHPDKNTMAKIFAQSFDVTWE